MKAPATKLKRLLERGAGADHRLRHGAHAHLRHAVLQPLKTLDAALERDRPMAKRHVLQRLNKDCVDKDEASDNLTRGSSFSASYGSQQSELAHQEDSLSSVSCRWRKN